MGAGKRSQAQRNALRARGAHRVPKTAISKEVKYAPIVDRKVINPDALIIFPGGRANVKDAGPGLHASADWKFRAVPAKIPRVAQIRHDSAICK